MWADLIYKHHRDCPACEVIDSELRTVQHDAARLYLAQKSAIATIDQTLGRAEIPYVIIKGANIRERIYEDAAYLRACADIDVLVSESDGARAINALTRQGFQIKPVSTVISHEISLFRGDATIDLHWGILRPGRVRGDLGKAALASRSVESDFATPDMPTTVLILLIHPAFTKYAASDIASLVRLVDLDRFLSSIEVNWKWTVDELSAYGAKTAAWTTLERLRQLVGHPIPEWVLEALQPRPVHKRYLTYWLKDDGARIKSSPLSLLRAILSLALQDRPYDAARALGVWAKEFWSKEKKLIQLMEGVD